MSSAIPRPRPEHRELARRVVQAGLPFDSSQESPRLARALTEVLANMDEHDRYAVRAAHEAAEGEVRRDVGERLLAQWLAERDPGDGD